MHQVRLGELPWTTVDRLHRLILDGLLVRFRIDGFTEAEIDHLNRVWHRLIPWSDAIVGINRLRAKYTVVALSNGNIALLTNMAKNAGVTWDCILSAELARHYKPDPEVYATAAELLGLAPPEVMMVAAHIHDLKGAQRVGFRTAFIPRPLEYGPDGTSDSDPDPTFDMVAADIIDLARQLGL